MESRRVRHDWSNLAATEACWLFACYPHRKSCVTSFVRIQPFCLWKYSMFRVVSNYQILLTWKNVWCVNHQHNKIMVYVWIHICPWMNIAWLYISILWLPFLNLCRLKKRIIMVATFYLCHCSFDFSLSTFPDFEQTHTPIYQKVKVKSWRGVCVCVLVASHVWLFATPRTVAHQAPLFMEFSRQEYWNVSRGFSWPMDWTQVSCIAGRFFTRWAIRKLYIQMYRTSWHLGTNIPNNLNFWLLHFFSPCSSHSLTKHSKILRWHYLDTW